MSVLVPQREAGDPLKRCSCAHAAWQAYDYDCPVHGQDFNEELDNLPLPIDWSDVEKA